MSAGNEPERRTNFKMEFAAGLMKERTDDMSLKGAPKRTVWTDDMSLKVERVAPKRTVFHCDQCNAVVGDSLSVCGEFMDSIMFLKVTDTVVVSDQVERKVEREITDCLHRSLKCSICRGCLGSVIVAAPQHLKMLRSVFLLHKENINCYILDTSSMVKASELLFDLRPIGESIEEIMEQFKALLGRMSCIEGRLREHTNGIDMDKH